MRALNLLVLVLCFITHKTIVSQQINNVQLYTFAHSLVDHRPPLVATPNDETTILFWIYDIAQNAQKTFATTGQFGQLPNHVDNLPPNSNLGYTTVPNSWDETQTSFANSNLNTILLTVANFIQYQSPSNSDPSDALNRSVITNTETLFDWTNNQKPNMRYYIYANWPEMDLQNAYPPTIPSQAEITNYHNITIGDSGNFANWWLEYQDLITASRPQLHIKLIPVGLLISKILRDIIPNQIPFNELYEDSSPHGRANIYFLAGLITYMALFEDNIPTSYMPSTIISAPIRTNLQQIKNFIWQELLAFNFNNGNSRVFYNTPTLNLENIKDLNKITLYPNPVKDSFKINFTQNTSYKVLIYNVLGSLVKQKTISDSNKTINIKNLKTGVYFVKIKNNTTVFKSKLFKIP